MSDKPFSRLLTFVEVRVILILWILAVASSGIPFSGCLKVSYEVKTVDFVNQVVDHFGANVTYHLLSHHRDKICTKSNQTLN